MSLPSRLLGANPSIQVSTLLSGSLSTPSAKNAFTFPTSFESIASATPSAVNGVTFSSIPATYQHLQLRISVRSPSGNPSLAMTFNSDSSALYTAHTLNSNGDVNITSSNSTSRTSMPLAFGQGMLTGYQNVAIVDIFDYASTVKLKSVRSLYGAKDTTSGQTELHAMMYRSLSAISSITIILTGGANYSSNSTISLYGIVG